MNQTYLAAAAVVALLVLVFATNFLLRRKPRKLNQTYYQARWQTLQGLLKEKATWPLAIIDADKLLDDALKKSHYRGKTMGERLMSAQREIKNNDEVWFGHKLRNQLVHEEQVKLTERKVKDALIGIRGALKDLGAL